MTAVRKSGPEMAPGLAFGAPSDDWLVLSAGRCDGLAPVDQKYHVFLSSIFRRAVRDRILVFNPCDHTELPKVILRKSHGHP